MSRKMHSTAAPNLAEILSSDPCCGRHRLRVLLLYSPPLEGMATTDQLLISASEINCLIYSYFRDSGERTCPLSLRCNNSSSRCVLGLQHAAFTLRSEAQLELSPYFNQHIPRGALVELLSKALLFIEAEKHWKGNFACRSGFSLLTPHVCDPEVPKFNTKPTDAPGSEHQCPQHHPPNGSSDGTIMKRKATPPPSNEGRAEKRAKIEQNDPSSTVPECCLLIQSPDASFNSHFI